MAKSPSAFAPSQASLRLKTADGLVWLTLQSVFGRGIGFAAQLALATILDPSDFGMIGLAYTGSAITGSLVNFGLEQVLVQRQNTIRLWIAPAFWLALGLGSAGLTVLLGFAPLAAHVYHEPEVAQLVELIALGMPFAAIATIPTAMLRAGLQFRRIAAVAFLEVMLLQALTIGFALLGFGALSFALPVPLVGCLKAVVLWKIAAPNVRCRLSRIRRARYLVSGTFAIFATGLVSAAVGQGDYIVLGMISSTAAVGSYFFAFKLAAQPLLLLASSFSNVLFPALSQLRTDLPAQSQAAFRAAKLLGLVVMPAAFLQAAVAAPALHLAFGAKWHDSIPLIQILSIALGFDAIAWVAGTLLLSQRRLGLQFAYVAIFAVIFFALVVAGGRNGSPVGVAIGVAAYYVLATPVYTYLVMRRSGVKAWHLAQLYLEPAALGGGATAIAELLLHFAGVQNDLLTIAFLCGLIAVSYVVLLRVCEAEAYFEIEALLRAVGQRLCAQLGTSAPKVSRG